MLHKKVVLTNLQIRCPKAKPKTLVEQIAGQLYNHHYTWSFPWCNGSMGRVILAQDFGYFYGEHKELCNDFYRAVDRKQKDRYSVELTVLPFPQPDTFPADIPVEILHEAAAQVLWAPGIISAALEERFNERLRMLFDSLQEEKRFYTSLLEELERVVNQGIYLAGSGKGKLITPDCIITPQLVGRIRAVQAGILIYSAEEIRQSTSAKEDVINQCKSIL